MKKIKQKKRKSSAEVEQLTVQILGERKAKELKAKHIKKKKKEKNKNKKAKESLEEILSHFKSGTVKRLGGFNNFKIDIAGKAHDYISNRVSQQVEVNRDVLKEMLRAFAMMRFIERVGKKPMKQTQEGIELLIEMVIDKTMKNNFLLDDTE